MLTLETLRDLLQSYVQRGYTFSRVCKEIQKEYKDITLFNEHYDAIQSQYEMQLSFREDRRNRFYNKAA